MKKIHHLIPLLLCGTLLTSVAAIAQTVPNTAGEGAAMQANTYAATRNLVTEEANRKLVIEFYERFFNLHEVHEAALVVAENYKQHNPDVPDGKAPFVEYFAQYFKDNQQSHARIIRSAADGDLVYLHVHSTNNPADSGQAVIDIFRVENGQLVEHWDVIQDVPAESANSNTMF